MAKTKTKPQFAESKLRSQKQRDDYTHARKRIQEMQAFRQREHYGVKLEGLWDDADRAYIPHRMKKAGKRVIAEDEDKGWRGAVVNLGTTQWQSDIAMVNPFVKMTVALSILIDQNPSGVFTALRKAFEATTILMEKLYERSWEVARSKGQLKLFVHNLSKYGWAIGRTYPLRIERKVRVLQEYNPEDPSKSKYEEKNVVEYNDIMRENLDPRNTWLDDMARPNDRFSVRDWCWRKVYTRDQAEEEFGKYSFWDRYKIPEGTTQETITKKEAEHSEKTNDQLVEIYFYESRIKDLFVVLVGGIDGVPVVMEPLPVSDEEGNKKLSCWHAYWNLRHAMSPYGIGIYEAIRFDQAFLDRIRNMTIDQLTLSIYKMFFYQSTQTLTDTGDIKITPGVGKQVLNPKDINWLDVPGPGKDAYEGIKMFKEDVDEASGVTPPLLGEITGKTAFEIAQAKEAAIKRLKVPLDNILDALNDEGYITIYLIQLLYSIPETKVIADPQLIDDYLKEIEGDSELYERRTVEDDDGNILTDEEGNPETEFVAKLFPEFPLNLDKDEQGNLMETEETKFFRVKPRFLKWEGIIHIKSQSLLAPSKQIEKALGLEMYNILIPLLERPPELYRKLAEDIVKMYDKDPRDILPEAWVGQDAQSDELFVDQPQPAAPEEDPGGGQSTDAPRFTAEPSVPANEGSPGGGIISRLMDRIR